MTSQHSSAALSGAGIEGRVTLAQPRGFCAGVRRAIGIAERAPDLHGAPHGVSPAVRTRADRRRLGVIDATCPLVAKVHQEAVRFVRDGRIILLVGHAGHEEVEGVLGEAPERTIVVETLHRRFTNIVGPHDDDICYASQNRQNAIKELACHNDLVLVVGSRNSSNSLRMVKVARKHGCAAHLVPDVAHLDERWLEGASRIGISSGASAPEILVSELVDRLTALGYGQVEVQQGAVEDVVFSIPGCLASPVTSRIPRTPLADEVR